MERPQKVKASSKLKTKSREDCKLCESKTPVSYKQPEELKRYMNKLGKILPRRASRLCAKHQRRVAREIKRARQLALLPYGTDHQ
ncbi:MAG: 30S ribosomal protein S18 [Candidatus Bipolaricaulota bacterium]|nr:30S ribosomal protein S18 [Candidatus Bipolaricaulota bacterium]MCS7274849.1 30S ribosomal protein S18 [Candidatus Bipolaricaulota bacterium]MDW8111270.1 30S ribosomal protein S18 [Candidatus Bipolaricaulota bacterium]MDW8328594.1 30S ribosomal protein S18 [Candidatus Bipolaricaulota bacterium]